MASALEIVLLLKVVFFESVHHIEVVICMHAGHFPKKGYLTDCRMKYKKCLAILDS